MRRGGWELRVFVNNFPLILRPIRRYTGCETTRMRAELRQERSRDPT